MEGLNRVFPGSDTSLAMVKNGSLSAPGDAVSVLVVAHDAMADSAVLPVDEMLPYQPMRHGC